MLETYQAVLRDNRIEWSGETPRHLTGNQQVAVHVTFLAVPITSDNSQGQRMAAALERLAASGALTEIADPAAWERDSRQDRPLPGRDS